MNDLASSSTFLSVWHDIMELLGIALFLVGVVMYIVYRIRLAGIVDPRQKYDFISKYEISYLRRMFYVFGLSAAMFVNMYGASDVHEMGVWFFMRAFVSIGIATLVSYVATAVLNFQYPSVLSRKLARWRQEPRINPETGNAMRLFNESEDFVRINRFKSSDQTVHSVDYDVWIDAVSGDVQIEEYDSRLAYLICRNCGHRTMRVVDEEIVTSKDGKDEMLRHYRCTFCKNVRATQFYISKKTKEEYKDQQPGEVLHSQNVDSVKIEIQSILFGKKFHEFNSLEKARQFLNEYESDKAT